MPGDPLRAKWIAETYLDDAVCYSTVRNMLGFTGRYNGVEVSIQGSGMGMPSASIYYHELMSEYGAQTVIRVGSCGAITDDLALRDVVAASSASYRLGDEPGPLRRFDRLRPGRRLLAAPQCGRRLDGPRHT